MYSHIMRLRFPPQNNQSITSLPDYSHLLKDKINPGAVFNGTGVYNFD